ncbi:MAG: 16S rRNA (guanine(966)-N(2))-methyltransferase RsmD [Proteobacteria bacterium]|nr:16S rRNA (guanine(966)-N(2))-methyltransferase RsmD [Pseudomonadota bacterium]
MRVISGSLKGRILKSPEGIRPLTDMIKEAIFNILQFENWEYLSVLDLFAGSGNFGIEALSRGAKSVMFVDKNPVSRIFIEKNINDGSYDYKILTGDVFSIIKKLFKKNLKFNIIFADPPFDLFLGNKILKELSLNNLLEEKGMIILRVRDKENIDFPEGFEIDKRVYGDSVIYFLRKVSR